MIELSYSATVVWVLAGLTFLLIELSTPGLFFFISFGFGCLFGALTAALGYSVTVQCSLALGVALFQFHSMRRVLNRFNTSGGSHTNIHALHGKEAIVVDAIIPPRNGQVKIGGEVWAARSSYELADGTEVIVESVRGNTVVVVPKEI
jgi:membrane protein implicated in regulation of membrane protease activity